MLIYWYHVCWLSKYFTSCQTGQTLGNTFKVNRVGRPMTSGLSSYGSKVQHLLHVRSGAGDSPPSAHSPAEVNRRYQDIIRSIINWSVKYQTVLIHRPHTLTIMPITLFNLLQATCKWNFLHDPCWSFNPVACYEFVVFWSRASFGSFEYPNSRNR